METIETGFVTSMVAVQVAAAALGLLVSLCLACGRISRMSASDLRPTAAARGGWLESLHTVALALVLASSTALFALWMERICVPGDAPMIFRMDLTRLPDPAMVKLVLVGVLATCAVWLAGARPARSRLRVPPTSTDAGVRLALGTVAGVIRITAPAACWLALAAVSLTQPLSQWPALATLSGIGLLWLTTATLIASAVMAWRQGASARLDPV